MAGWFLRRYDVAAASAVLKTITLTRLETDRTVQSGLGQKFLQRVWKPFALSLLLLLFLLVATSDYLLDLLEYQPFSINWMRFFPLLSEGRLTNVQVWHVLLYLVGSVLLLASILWIVFRRWHRRKFDNLRRLLPRLFGGILVGYVPLMSAEDLWKWLLQVQIVPATILWLLTLLLSLGYLYIEARNTLTEGELSGTMRKELRIRVFHVLFIGLSEVLIIGIVLSELFGETVAFSLLGDIKTPVIAVTGWIGYVFPKVILLYAPLALFLGILVQLIWDEKTVAQPL